MAEPSPPRATASHHAHLCARESPDLVDGKRTFAHFIHEDTPQRVVLALTSSPEVPIASHGREQGKRPAISNRTPCTWAFKLMTLRQS